MNGNQRSDRDVEPHMRLLFALTLLAGVLLAACSDDAGTQVQTGDDGGTAPALEYEADLTVLESPEHGPQLCEVVMDSLPPQCGGPDIVGWDWDAVEGSESVNGTTWGDYHVVGTWSVGTFTLTRPATAPTGTGTQDDYDFSPGCDEPEVVDPSQGADAWEASGDLPELPELVALWVSYPGSEWDGPFVANVVVRPGAGVAARTAIREHYLGPLCVTERDSPTQAELYAIQEEVTEELDVAGAGTNEIESVVEARVWVADDDAVEAARERWGELVRLQGILQPVS